MAAFFGALGAERAKALTQLSADAAEWIEVVVAERAPHAVRCMDPYHLVGWGGDALDKVRRQVWNAERGGVGGRTQTSVMLKGARWALWKNPDRLTAPQQATLAVIQKTNQPLHRPTCSRNSSARLWRSRVMMASYCWPRGYAGPAPAGCRKPRQDKAFPPIQRSDHHAARLVEA